MRECLSEEVVQRYLDGELAPERMRWVAAHITVCAFCAEAVREAEGETELLAAAFRMPADVPTERLRERLDRALAELDPPSPQEVPADIDRRARAWFPLPTAPVFKPLQAYVLALIALGAVITLGMYLNSRTSTGGTRGLVVRTESQHRAQLPSGANENTNVSKHIPTVAREVVEQKDRQGGPARGERSTRGVRRKAEQALAKLPLIEDKRKNGQVQTLAGNEEENEEVKARLMLALHIASAKLNFAQKEVQRTLQRNRPEPAS